MAMEYMHATLMLHESGREINEDNITAILEANGTHVIESRVKAIVAALEGVDIGAIEPEPDPAIAASVRGDDVTPEAVLESGIEAESGGTGARGPDVDGGNTAGVEAEQASDSGGREGSASDGNEEVPDDGAREAADEDGSSDDEFEFSESDSPDQPDEVVDDGETVGAESVATSAAGDSTDAGDTGEESSTSADETSEESWEFPESNESESQSSDEADDEEDGAR